MKILHVITSLRTRGAEKLIVDLLPRFKRNGIDVDLLLFDGTETPFMQIAKAEGINIINFGKGSSVYNPLHAIRLAWLMRKYDIVHTHNTACQLFGAFASLFCKTKLVTTEHSSSNRRRGSRLLSILDRWMYSRYHRIICIARQTEENLRKHLGNNRINDHIITIPNGVDVTKYSSATPSTELRDMLPNGAKAITMVAGFRWEKDQDTLIKAMRFLPETFHLFLIGHGVRINECRLLVEKESVTHRTHFLGIRSDVPQLLRASDYIVMSSHFEGMSLSSIEGMSAGKAFLASDVDGLREVVQGVGILFPHGDFRQLAQEIIALDNDSAYYNHIAMCCHRRASTFDIYIMAENYLNLYSSII